MSKINKFAFFDLDMTLYAGYSMADFFFKNIIPYGRATQEQSIAAKDILDKYMKGELSYSDTSIQSVQLSAEIIRNKTVAEVKKWQEKFFSTDKLFTYVLPLFEYLKNNGFKIYIVSGSIEPIVSVNAKILGVQGLYSELETKNGQYSGNVLSILNYVTKEEAISDILDSVDGEVLSIAVGDSSGDIDMLQKVTHGFLFEPHEDGLAQKAKEMNIPVVTNDSIIDAIKTVL